MRCVQLGRDDRLVEADERVDDHPVHVDPRRALPVRLLAELGYVGRHRRHREARPESARLHAVARSTCSARSGAGTPANSGRKVAIVESPDRLVGRRVAREVLTRSPRPTAASIAAVGTRDVRHQIGRERSPTSPAINASERFAAARIELNARSWISTDWSGSEPPKLESVPLDVPGEHEHAQPLVVGRPLHRRHELGVVAQEAQEVRHVEACRRARPPRWGHARQRAASRAASCRGRTPTGGSA